MGNTFTLRGGCPPCFEQTTSCTLELGGLRVFFWLFFEGASFLNVSLGCDYQPQMTLNSTGGFLEIWDVAIEPTCYVRF